MRAKLVNVSENLQELSYDELKEIMEKDPNSKKGIEARVEIDRRRDVNGSKIK